MAKVFDYKLYQGEGTDGKPILLTVTMEYSEENQQIAGKEAYNGEVSEAYEADRPDHTYEPSQLDILEAQVTYTAMMTDTLLEV